MIKLKTAGTRNYCREAYVVFSGLNISLVSCCIEICTINRDGKLTMKFSEEELSAADKRHLRTFCKRFKHRMCVPD